MIKKTDEGVEVNVSTPTEKGAAVRDAIINACKEHGVAPSEIFPVLGEAIIRILVISAQVLGYDEVSYVHNFGDGLANCELEFKNKGN